MELDNDFGKAIKNQLIKHQTDLNCRECVFADIDAVKQGNPCCTNTEVLDCSFGKTFYELAHQTKCEKWKARN